MKELRRNDVVVRLAKLQAFSVGKPGLVSLQRLRSVTAINLSTLWKQKSRTPTPQTLLDGCDVFSLRNLHWDFLVCFNTPRPNAADSSSKVLITATADLGPVKFSRFSCTVLCVSKSELFSQDCTGAFEHIISKEAIPRKLGGNADLQSSFDSWDKTALWHHNGKAPCYR